MRFYLKQAIAVTGACVLLGFALSGCSGVIGGSSSSALGTIVGSTPVITSISPSTVVSTGTPSAFTLTVSGYNFTNGDEIYIGSTALNTSCSNSSTLTASVQGFNVSSSGNYNICVKTASGDTTTNSKTLSVTIH
jgi:hypothetical protein